MLYFSSFKPKEKIMVANDCDGTEEDRVSGVDVHSLVVSD